VKAELVCDSSMEPLAHDPSEEPHRDTTTPTWQPASFSVSRARAGGCLQAFTRRADERLEANTGWRVVSTSVDEPGKPENRRFAGTFKRLMGLEPTTFCMASRP
jgi:hypothetical protein